jgi:hypothetical protein
MAARTAWVLNLDADLEMAAPHSYAPTRAVLAAMRTFVPIVAASLLGPDDVLVDESSTPGSARGFSGRAFSPTPRALSLLRRAGAEPAPYPSLDVLRAVNSRAFCASLGPTLKHSAFVTEEGAALVTLETAPAPFTAWRLKRAFGMNGRAQRIVEPGALSSADRAFLRAAIAEGGVQLEPQVPIVREYAMHGLLGADGSLRVGTLLEQRCDARGAWLGSKPVASEPIVRRSLADETARVAAALTTAGYFGPFGIDAFSYRDPGTDELCLQPRSEINARYSMGFTAGFVGVAKTDRSYYY